MLRFLLSAIFENFFPFKWLLGGILLKYLRLDFFQLSMSDGRCAYSLFMKHFKEINSMELTHP